jgi:hypothetical protein
LLLVFPSRLQACLYSRHVFSSFCGESISIRIYATQSLLSLPTARDSNRTYDVLHKLLIVVVRGLTFIPVLLLADATLFVRTLFRSVELSQGFGGKLANSQVQFMILGGCMVIMACSCMTLIHSGYAFQKR